MSEVAAIEIGQKIVSECDPREIATVLLTEVFPDLRYSTIFRHFGRKMAILAYREKERVSIGEAVRYIDNRFIHNY